MTFDRLADFQDGLIRLGIGGNDCAVYVDGEPVYRHFAGWQNLEEKIPVSANTLSSNSGTVIVAESPATTA